MTETFRLLAWGWDVERALAITADQEPVDTITVAEAAPMLRMIRVDSEHAKTADLSRPVIAILMPGGPDKGWGHMLIDGWHRLHRAHADGVPELPCILLTEQQERDCRDPRGMWDTWDALAAETGPRP